MEIKGSLAMGQFALKFMRLLLVLDCIDSYMEVENLNQV